MKTTIDIPAKALQRARSLAAAKGITLEKGLKGRYTEKLGKEPPKTHNLLYLIEKMK